MKLEHQKRAVSLIQTKGLRVTSHRVAIVSYLTTVKHPVTVQELVDVLTKEEDIDQATIYRNLSTLHDAQLVRRLDFNHGHAHYELENGIPSYQLVCSKCETIEKIPGLSMGTLVKDMVKKSKKFKQTVSHSLEVYGVCKQCA